MLHEAFPNLPQNTWEPSPLLTWRGGSTELDDEEVDEESQEEEEDDESDEEEDDEAEEDKVEKDENPLSSVMSMEPVPVTVRSAFNDVLDQSLELTVMRNRDVASIKQSISRQLPGRPPMAAIQLTYHGQILDDEILVDELVDDEEEDEDDEDEDEGPSLTLVLDMVPPVDPRFVGNLQAKIHDLTTAELLEAYAANEAAMYENAAMLMAHEASPEVDDDEDTDESATPTIITPKLKERADRIRDDLQTKLLVSEDSRKILEHPVAPSAEPKSRIEVRGDRVRTASGNGLKLQIQRNLNIHWGDTIRHFCLFLFFGYFGGRTPFSRAILLLGAPSVFLLQARPVKLMIKQVVYALLDHPPGILLSLLPAPQQAILSMDYAKSMKAVYGDYAIIEDDELVVEDEDEDVPDTTVEEEDDDDDEFVDDEEEESEEYDEDYDEDEDYE